MRTESRKTELKITSDARVRAGVRSALKHICERHGFTKEEQRELAAAVEKECGNALENHDGPICAVTIEEGGDRIEVSVEPAREANAAESNPRESSSAKTSENRLHAEAKNPTGGAQHAAGNGRMCATLVRYFHKNPTHS
ncbi:MAG: hypothetical protein WBD87_17245 [Candidatus Acidiferrales bacterium]